MVGDQGEQRSAPVLLGEALVQDGLLTREQLDRATRIQSYLEQPKRLGELVVELGYATKQDIAKTLSKHGASMRLGDILLEQGLIDEDGLDQALEYHRKNKVRLGQAMIQLGLLTERILLQNLARQAGIPFIEPVYPMIETALLKGVSPEYLDRHKFVPFSRGEDGTVTVVVSDLDDEEREAAISELFPETYALALGPADAIDRAIEDHRRFRQSEPARDEILAEEEAEDSVVQLVDHLIVAAIEERASDVHVEPMSNVIRVRYRIDGALVYKTDLPKDLLARLLSRIKILADCNIAEHQHHQGGRIFYQYQGREYDLRVSFYVTVHGQCAVLRILNKQTGLVDLVELGMDTAMLERFRYEVLDVPTGVVLITGPTGSGKTTTLYSSLSYSNSIDMKIITAEDPVEYMIDGIIQCSIHDKIGRTYESTLREIVRQDPDVVVLGEIRDQISAETAIQAALTGHKVYSTFHTEDTIGGLLRLIDMDIETFLISSTVISVLAQRLLRRICEHCAAPHTPNPSELERLGLSIADVHDFDFKKGRGCNMCNHTGYHGRIGAFELLILNEEVKEAILQKKPSHIIRQTCTDSTGLISIREDGIAKVVRGHTTFEEVLRQTPRTFNMRPLRQILAMTQQDGFGR